MGRKAALPPWLWRRSEVRRRHHIRERRGHRANQREARAPRSAAYGCSSRDDGGAEAAFTGSFAEKADLVWSRASVAWKVESREETAGERRAPLLLSPYSFLLLCPPEAGGQEVKL
jgi:hypothetical protein